MKLDFTDQVVCITGASRGIGRATARLFAEAGARVVVHYGRNRPAAESTLAELAGAGHLLVQADMADPTEIQQMTETIVREVGRIDVLVNNAGIYDLHPLVEQSYITWQQAWRHTLEVNLIGTANLTFCVAQQMIVQGGGKIVNISSRGAFRGEPEAPAYGASKAGLNAMSQSLAKALAPHNIFIYVVAPGFVETDMAAEILAGPEGEDIRQQSPLGRVALPDEVARTALFLASAGAEFLTGCIVDVNGASYLRT